MSRGKYLIRRYQLFPELFVYRFPSDSVFLSLSSAPLSLPHPKTQSVTVLEMPFSGNLQNETKPIPMKLQPQKLNTKYILFFRENTNF